MSTNGSSQTDARHCAVPAGRGRIVSRHGLFERLDRLRLEGELTEVGGADLRFTVDEARALFGLLELELRRTESAGLADLHGMAAGRHAAHAALIAEVLSLLAGNEREPPVAPTHLREQLTESEIRVLRYLPTNLRAPEIATDLCLSVNTVRTHVRHVYEKLAAHSRIEAVERARALGLLAPSSLRA